MLVGIIPINFVIMGIRVLITAVMISFVALDFCTTIATDFSFEDITIVHYGCFDFSGFSPVARILRFVRIWPPLATVSTTSTLANPIWFHYIIISGNCTTDFIAIQIFFR